MVQENCSYLSCVDFWAEILALSKLVGLQSLACVGQIFQPFVSSILSPSIFLWRLTRNTAQIELSKERHSNFKSSHFKAMCGFYWVFCSAHLYRFSLFAQAINYISEHPRGEVFLSCSSSEEAIPQNIEQLSKVTEKTRSKASSPNSCAVCSLQSMEYAVKEIFFSHKKENYFILNQNQLPFLKLQKISEKSN